MFSLRNILVPTDFSQRAACAARGAGALADRFGARLSVLHVLPHADESMDATDKMADLRKLEARNKLEAFAERELANRNAVCELQEGDPASVIVDRTHATGVDLIMMPTSGCGPFRRFILGSVTAKVLHDVACPVWTGEHVEQMPSVRAGSPRTILCALDLRQDSRRVLGWGADLASRAGAALAVVHAIPSLEYSPETYYIEADMRRFLVRQAREKIARMLASTAVPGGRIFIEGGAVARVVQAAAEDCHADLVVIGRASGAGLLGRLRTNSYAVIRESPCPVVSV